MNRGHSERDRGAAAVEFALILPLLLMLAFGTIDFSYLINRSTVLNNAAREGAREAIFNRDAVAIEARVRAVADNLDQSDLTVTITCKNALGADCPGVSFQDEWEPGGSVIVRLDYTHDYLTPTPGVLGMGTTRNLSSTVEMRIEG